MTAPASQTEPSASFLPDDFFQVPASEAEAHWGVLSEILDPVFERTRKITSEDILEQILDLRAMLWCLYLDGMPAAVVITTIEFYPQRNVFQVALAAGRDAHRWGPLVQPILERYARSIGCQSIEIVGRRGWGRLFPEYTEIETTFSKELTDG